MIYDSNQLDKEILALNHNKEIAFQQYHKICGAIEMVEAMRKKSLEHEESEKAKPEALKESDFEPVPESVEAA